MIFNYEYNVNLATRAHGMRRLFLDEKKRLKCSMAHKSKKQEAF